MASSQGSVGRALESNMSFGISHPMYTSLQDLVEKKTIELAAARGATRKSVTPYFSTVALKSEELARVSHIYPELRFVNVGYMRAAHPIFVLSRRAAIAWCLVQARKLTEEVVVYGSPLLSVVEAGFSSAVMYVDGTSPGNIHERHTSAMDARNVYSDHVKLSKESGVPLKRSCYDDFLRGKRVKVTMDESFPATAEVMCVDGMMSAYGPMQVALLMEKCGASVTYGTLPYHPTMLMNRTGKLLNYGVHFSRTEDAVRFIYPDGSAGVAEYTLDAWSAWLTSHTFSVGVRKVSWFQLELLKNRDGILFYRMTKLDCQPTHTQVVHALELPTKEPMYVIRSWRLKNLTGDVSDPDNWASEQYMASKRLVDRVYQMVMNLPREQFTRFAIRKQLRIVNDRVTVEGTSVKVNPSLDEATIDALVSDIFSRAFADRYAAGTLTEKAKEIVDQLSSFSEMSSARRTWVTMSLAAIGVWDSLVAPADNWLKTMCDKVRKLVSSKELSFGQPSFDVAPSYITIGDGNKLFQCDNQLDVVREITRKSGLSAVGFGMTLARVVASVQDTVSTQVHVFSASLINVFEGVQAAQTENADNLVKVVRGLNEMDEAPITRRQIDATTVTRAISGELVLSLDVVPDPVYVFNEFYSELFPGIAEQNLEYDIASISLDPQDRHLAASYMRLPKYFGDVAKPKRLYHSKLKALNVPKRQQLLTELISAVAARNLNAPQVALPQDDSLTAMQVWNNFLDKACEPDARLKLQAYQTDPVSIEEEGLREWISQSSPDKVESVIRDLEDTAKSLGDMDVGDYLVMLKSDVKPSLSRKPMYSRTEAQVIVYHEKPLSAFYSSIFRVLVRRFMSLLKPNIHVNLLKDSKDMEAFVRAVHPYGAENLAFLENDFSKYDKSQGKFVFVLEHLIFSELGMNQELLAKWLKGHERCNLRAVGLGMSLHVLYQRKSGDATTAFGNVLLNITSVMYAYQPAMVYWALFMGDDSLMCAAAHSYREDAPVILAEVFNLGAKMYCTDAPYFASNFVVINDLDKEVFFIPDPVKRIERWSMMISGDDPQWDERYISARDAMINYLNCYKTAALPRMIQQRYGIRADLAKGLPDALATVVSDRNKFRAMWEEIPQISFY